MLVSVERTRNSKIVLYVRPGILISRILDLSAPAFQPHSGLRVHFLQLQDSHEPSSSSDTTETEAVGDNYWLDLATQPHDAFFKEIFSNRDDACAFFRKHLPPEIVRTCDWLSLKVIPGSFVKSTLQKAYDATVKGK